MTKRHAFTLMEMLVTVTVTSVLVTIMMSVLMSGSTLWQKNEEKLDTFREARAAMQMITRDFSGLNAVPELPDQFPILALRNHSETIEADKVNREFYGIVPARNTGRSGLCAVGYFCVWNEAKRAFVLRRQFTESNATFNNLKTALVAGSPFSPATAFDQLYARPAAGVSTAQQNVEDIATYVYEFKVDWEKTSPAAGQAPVQEAWPHNFSRELPAWVEIRFKALGANAARKLTTQPVTRETWFMPESSTYKTLILPGEQEFVTRIKLSR